MRARVLEVDGEVVGIGGYWVLNGVAIVFSDVAGDISPIRIWREAVEFMNDLDMPARCVADAGSEKFLKRLGWVHLGSSDDGEVFEWQE